MIFKIKNTTSKQEWTFDVEDTKQYGRVYDFSVTFTQNMPEGEYEATLIDENKTVWTGLAQIGAVVRVGENQKSHENNIEFKQYEG